MLRRIGPIYKPVTVAKTIHGAGASLRKAHQALNRIVADETVAIRLPAVPDLAAFVDEMAALGVQVEVRSVPDEVDVRRIRQRLALTQEEFATRFGLALDTVQNWEQGRNVPDGPVRTLLRVIERHPELVEDVLTDAAPPSEMAPA